MLLASSLLALAACEGSHAGEESVSEQDVRVKANRQRLARFARVDGFARLYLGESLAPAELAKLANKSEAAVVEALTSRAQYKQRFALRVGAFLDNRLLKTKQRNGKSLFEQTTVVITSEFSRPSNASGNEDSSGAFGAGHYNFNNNVIMFGKGVRGGGWIGQNDPVTQYAHLVETASLEQSDPNGIRYSVPDFFTLDEASNTKKVPQDGRIEGLAAESAIDFAAGEKRPIMTKDIVRTVFKIAGADSKFRSVYSGQWFADAKALGPTIA